MCFLWFENLREPNSVSLDALREFFSISKDRGSRSAKRYCKDVVAILTRFMRLHRRIAENNSLRVLLRRSQ
jgi:hypothetical protein